MPSSRAGPPPRGPSCPPENIWLIVQEPPNEQHSQDCLGAPCYAKVFMPDGRLADARHLWGQCAIPWHVNRSYDELLAARSRRRPASCRGSRATSRSGQGTAIGSVSSNAVTGEVPLYLYGRGFREIADKWDGLAPYRYSWRWRISGATSTSRETRGLFPRLDAPFYYGATQIHRFFPPQSMVQIDIRSPDEAIRTIREVLAADLWQERLPYLSQARELALNRYQMFPFLASEIRAVESRRGAQPLPASSSPSCSAGVSC